MCVFVNMCARKTSTGVNETRGQKHARHVGPHARRRAKLDYTILTPYQCVLRDCLPVLYRICSRLQYGTYRLRLSIGAASRFFTQSSKPWSPCRPQRRPLLSFSCHCWKEGLQAGQPFRFNFYRRKSEGCSQASSIRLLNFSPINFHCFLLPVSFSARRVALAMAQCTRGGKSR